MIFVILASNSLAEMRDDARAAGVLSAPAVSIDSPHDRQLDTSTKVLIEAGSAHVGAWKGWFGGG